MSVFYVYRWIRPDTGAVFYVGKGCFVRDVQPKKHNKIFTRIVAKLEHMGIATQVERILDGLTEPEAFEIERAEIAKHGRIDKGTGTLANMTDGGEGATGVVRSAETRAKLSASLKGNRNMVGRTLNQDSRAKIGATKIGNAYFLGKTHTPEARAKIADGARGNKNMLGKKRSPETIAKMSLALTGRVISEETRRKLSIANIGKTASAEARAKISAANKGKPKPPFGKEHREKMSKAKRMAPPKSGFKGVSFFANRKKWRAAMTVDGVSRFIGDFNTPEDAARAYDKAVIAEYGYGNCYINFLKEEVIAC